MSAEKQRLTAGAANVVIKIEINAPVAKAWRNLNEDISQWWRADFLICEGSKGMHLAPRVGGMLFEKTDDNGGGIAGGISSHSSRTNTLPTMPRLSRRGAARRNRWCRSPWSLVKPIRSIRPVSRSPIP